MTRMATGTVMVTGTVTVARRQTVPVTVMMVTVRPSRGPPAGPLTPGPEPGRGDPASHGRAAAGRGATSCLS
jgi:hypothetical protein